MPAPVSGPVTQGFGPTDEPLDGPYAGYPHYNKGYDFGVPIGTPVQAVVAGTVVSAGDQGDGWGYSVKIRDSQGYTHNYGHLDAPIVKAGDTIRVGQVVGRSGNSGASTGPHLSYDVWDSSGTFVDPSPWLTGDGGGGGSDQNYGAAGAQLQEILSELLRNQPTKEQFTDAKYGFDAAAYSQSFNEWAKQITSLQSTIGKLNQAELGFAELPDGTVIPLGDLTPEQRAQMDASNQTAYTAILNQFGLDQYNLLDQATASQNQSLIDQFNMRISGLNASLDYDTTNLQKALGDLNRWVQSEAIAGDDAQRVLDAQKMGMEYGTTPGKSSFSAADLGGAVTALAQQAGVGANPRAFQSGFDPTVPLINYPGTQNIDPVQQRLDSLAGMGVGNTPPLIPGLITPPSMIPGAPPVLSMPPPPPTLLPPMIPIGSQLPPLLPPPPAPSYSSPAETISSRGGGFQEL